jgi:hypothetical protein
MEQNEAGFIRRRGFCEEKVESPLEENTNRIDDDLAGSISLSNPFQFDHQLLQPPPFLLLQTKYENRRRFEETALGIVP